jgi:hypothetical protein
VIIKKAEKKKFQDGVKKYKGVANIPNDKLLSGFYLKQNRDGSNDWWGENDFQNMEIPANQLTFPKEIP